MGGVLHKAVCILADAMSDVEFVLQCLRNVMHMRRASPRRNRTVIATSADRRSRARLGLRHSAHAS
eukprot:5853821-Prymnesium_polylepis.1